MTMVVMMMTVITMMIELICHFLPSWVWRQAALAWWPYGLDLRKWLSKIICVSEKRILEQGPCVFDKIPLVLHEISWDLQVEASAAGSTFSYRTFDLVLWFKFMRSMVRHWDVSLSPMQPRLVLQGVSGQWCCHVQPAQPWLDCISCAVEARPWIPSGCWHVNPKVPPREAPSDWRVSILIESPVMDTTCGFCMATMPRPILKHMAKPVSKPLQWVCATIDPLQHRVVHESMKVTAPKHKE